MNKKIIARVLAILLVVAMLAGSGFYIMYLFADDGLYAYAADAGEPHDRMAQLESIINVISSNYKEKMTAEELVDAAYDGVFAHLDPWSEYYPSEEEEEEFLKVLDGEKYCGVGLTLQKNADDTILIVSVNISGPAFDAGIKKNSCITHVNGQSVLSMSLDKAADMLRGEEGSKVNLTVMQDGVSKEYTLVRRALTASVVSYSYMPDEKIAYISIDSFNQGTGEDFEKNFLAGIDDGAKSFIIDLRDNTGGYMGEALYCASCICPVNSDILYYMNDGKVVDRVYVSSNDVGSKKYGVVVLINENTASASEALAAALKDNGVAKLVGVTSFGKGVAQEIFEGEAGDSFKLSTCYFTGPKKQQIDGCGVKPDYVVYNNGGLTQEQILSVTSVTIPMNEGKKYTATYSYGLNVLAAQQRLKAMGFDVPTTSILDGPTRAALSEIQKEAGGCPYGGLDFFTIKALDAKFNAFLYGSNDAQLDKAIELLSK